MKHNNYEMLPLDMYRYNCKCRADNIPYPKRTDQKQTSTFVEVKMQCHHKGQNDLLITEKKFMNMGLLKLKLLQKYVYRQTTTTDATINMTIK